MWSLWGCREGQSGGHWGSEVESAETQRSVGIDLARECFRNAWQKWSGHRGLLW